MKQGLSPATLSIIGSYIDQLERGKDVQLRISAALALGNANLFPVGELAAAGLDVWKTLANVILTPDDDPGVHEAVSVALASLVTPAPGPDADKAWPVLRNAISDIMKPDFVGELALHITSAISSRNLASLCRIVCGLAKFTNPHNEDIVLNAGLLGSLVATIGSSSEARDGATAALAALHLAASSPGLFKAAVRRPSSRSARRTSVDEFADDPEYAEDYQAEGFNIEADAGVKANLFAELCKLYSAAIDPERMSPTAIPLPSDAASLIMQAVQLEPKGMSGPGPRKALLRRLVDSGAPACLVSYLVVESGAVRAALCDLATSTADMVEAIVQSTESRIETMQLQMDEMRGQIKVYREEIAEAYACGRDQEEWVHNVKVDKNETKVEYRALRAQWAILTEQRVAATQGARALRAWAARNARPARKVRLTAPNLVVLKQAVGVLGSLSAGPPKSADAEGDPEAEALSKACGAALLASGLIPAAVRLSKTSEAAGGVVAVIGALVSQIGLTSVMENDLQFAAKIVAELGGHVVQVLDRIDTRLKAVRAEAKRVGKALDSGTAQGGVGRQPAPLTEHNTMSPSVTAYDLVRRSDELALEMEQLGAAQGLLLRAEEVLAKYNMSIATHQELLQQAVYRAASVLPPPPPFQDTDASSPPLHPQNQSAPGNFSPPRRPSSTNGGRRSSGAVPLPPRREDLLPTLAQRLRPLAQPRDHLASLERVITGCRSGGATGSGAAASPSASSGRPSSAKAGGKSRPASARAGSGAGSPLGAAAAPKRPASAGAAQAVKASAFSSASNYKNIVFTQSPMRGHAPRAMGGSNNNNNDNNNPAIPEGALGPDLTQVPLLDVADGVIQAVRGCGLLRPIDESVLGPLDTGEDLATVSHLPVLFEDEGEGEEGEGRETTPPKLFIDAMLKDTTDLTTVLNSLSSLSSTCSSLTRSARLLPTGRGLDLSAMHPKQLVAGLPGLMETYAAALSRADDCHAVVAAIADVAAVAHTRGLADYERIYLRTGVVQVLVGLLDGKRRHQQARDRVAAGAGSEAEEGPRAPSGGQRLVTGGLRQSPRQLQSRYNLAPPVMRPSTITVSEQTAAAKALVGIGSRHPEVLAAVAADKEALASLCDLSMDHSVQPEARLSAATLLSKMVSCGGEAGDGDGGGEGSQTQGVPPAAIEAGAFTALMGIMDSDHRKGSGGAKEAVVTALARVASDEGLRQNVVEALENLASASPRSGVSPRAASAAAVPRMVTAEDVLLAVLRALWGVPNQLVQLMSSDRTKQGRTVDPAVVKPLTSLSSLACQQLSGLAAMDPEAKRMLKGIGIAKRINITFMQSIKDAGLQGALLELKASVQ